MAFVIILSTVRKPILLLLSLPLLLTPNPGPICVYHYTTILIHSAVPSSMILLRPFEPAKPNQPAFW